MRIHSREGTNSAPRSAMRPTRSMQFSCTCQRRGAVSGGPADELSVPGPGPNHRALRGNKLRGPMRNKAQGPLRGKKTKIVPDPTRTPSGATETPRDAMGMPRNAMAMSRDALGMPRVRQSVQSPLGIDQECPGAHLLVACLRMQWGCLRMQWGLHEGWLGVPPVRTSSRDS